MLYRNLPVLLLVLAVLLTGIGSRLAAKTSLPTPPAGQTAAATLDEGLGERVETLLRTDVGLTGASVRVRVEQTVVVIAGTVPDEQALRRAMELAASVKGVRQVRNDMEIADPK